MKFVVLFVVCCVALAVADDKISEEDATEILNELKEKFNPDCNKLEEACGKFIAEIGDANDLVPGCVSIADKYYCKGATVADVVGPLNELAKKINHS